MNKFLGIAAAIILIPLFVFILCCYLFGFVATLIATVLIAFGLVALAGIGAAILALANFLNEFFGDGN